MSKALSLEETPFYSVIKPFFVQCARWVVALWTPPLLQRVFEL